MKGMSCWQADIQPAVQGEMLNYNHWLSHEVLISRSGVFEDSSLLGYYAVSAEQ